MGREEGVEGQDGTIVEVAWERRLSKGPEILAGVVQGAALVAGVACQMCRLCDRHLARPVNASGRGVSVRMSLG